MGRDARVALVTGAAGNMGTALVALLAARGWRVAALDRAREPLEEMATRLPAGSDPLLLPGVDLTDPAACRAAVEAVTARLGRLDAVAHTVGGFAMSPAAEATPAVFEQMFRLNLLTTANLFGAALVPMRAARRGSLVAISAIAAARAPAGLAAYAASKAGVLKLVESYAEELKREGVRVNAVMPGTVDTPQNRASMPDADPSSWVKPAEIAEAIAYLISDAASGVTGTGLPITGRS